MSPRGSDRAFERKVGHVVHLAGQIKGRPTSAGRNPTRRASCHPGRRRAPSKIRLSTIDRTLAVAHGHVSATFRQAGVLHPVRRPSQHAPVGPVAQADGWREAYGVRQDVVPKTSTLDSSHGLAPTPNDESTSRTAWSAVTGSSVTCRMRPTYDPGSAVPTLMASPPPPNSVAPPSTGRGGVAPTTGVAVNARISVMVMLPVAGRTASIRSLPFVEGACEARTPNPHVAAMADGPGEAMIEAPPRDSAQGSSRSTLSVRAQRVSGPRFSTSKAIYR